MASDVLPRVQIRSSFIDEMMQFNLRGESRMQQLSGQDASFVYMETPTTPMHIGSVGIYDPSTAPNGFVRFKDILQFIESRLGGAKSFRERLVRVPFDIDHPYWIQDPDFDLEYHVRHIALPAPGDWRQLCIQVARLHSRPMDLTKPLWEFIIVEGLDNIEGLPKGCFALVAKVHHAAIDGMSGVEMSAAVHDLSPDKSNRFAQEDWKPDSKPGIGDLLISGYFNALRQPQKYLETMARSVPGIARLASELTKGDLSIAGARVPPKTRFNAKVSSHRVFDGVPFPLSDVRAIKDAVPGATVNDAILTIIGGGLRIYLNEKGELPEANLTAMAPISVRQETEKAALGNLVSAMVVSLGTHIADPLERLAHIHADAVNSKGLTNAVGARTLTDYSQLIPSGLAGLGARLYTRLGVANATAPVFNVVATNVPGSRVPLYFCGAKMVKMYGLGPIFDSVGLINTIYSYVDEIAISFTSDRDMMPDPDAYAAALRQSFAELLAATKAPPTPAAKTPKSLAKTRKMKETA
jgi:diacylglycerol O-acyltransferase